MAYNLTIQRLEFPKYIPRICFSNIIILITLTIFVNLILSFKTGFSVFAGGAIGVINFYTLSLTIKNSIAVSKDRIKGFVAVRYWLRFGMIAIILFYLVSRSIINPAAFIFGFTLVVINTFLAALSAAKEEGF